MVSGRRSLKNSPWFKLRRLCFGALGMKSIVALILLLFCVILYLCASILLGPVGGSPPMEEKMQISSGMNATEIGNLLENRGFIKSSFMFRLASSLKGTNKSLKAGEYIVNTDMGALQILSKIASGDSVLYRFTVPEGFTLSQIAELWEKEGFGTKPDLMKVSRDSAISEKHKIDASSLEGYLFPDTYMFPRGISEQEAAEKMLDQFSKELLPLMADGPTDMNYSIHEIVTLASIIEREALLDDEKPIISAVFHNRLKRGRRLESCVTVLYSLGYPRRKLTTKDLRNPSSPYNTYVYKGLPPGPICNPGLESIKAALIPSKDKYLYFVSKNDGTHFFTESYSKFLDAKRRY